MGDFVIGVDVGTGSVRAGIFTLDGRFEDSAFAWKGPFIMLELMTVLTG